METSQQQRRPTVGQFAKTLADTQLDFDAIDLADILWLAQFIEPAASVQVDTPVPKTGLQSQPIQAIDSTEPALDIYPDEQLPSQARQASTESEQPTEKSKGTPFSVPAAPALRTRMNLARSLRPLMRKVPSQTRFDLDEDATVTQIAETEVWMPVVRPRQERWLELDLVVEDSKTTVIWERAIAELNHLAEYQGAFRAVRTWRLSASAGKVQLFSRWNDRPIQSEAIPILANRQRPHTPRELIDPTGRRLIWLVTDCTSLLWRQDLIYETLLDWAKVQPIAIVQMFPERLWSRTALRDGHIVRLSALAPGVPSARLEIEGLPQRLERRRGEELVTVPIITLDAVSMGLWSQVAAGTGSRTPGRTFDLSFIRRQAEKGVSDRSRSASQRTAQERVALFRATASKTAQQLADLMAATPVSLPVIDLLRDAFRADFEEEIQQAHVAEVLLSGLLQRCDMEADAVCRYEFWGDDASNWDERVRYILLGDASISKTNQVLNVLSEVICQKLNLPSKSFQALLSELKDSEEGDLRAATLPFARVGLDVLHRMGGEYAALARRYDPEGKNNPAAANLEQNDFPPQDLEDLEYEVAKLINFPSLQPCEYESATISAILDRFDYETATFKLENRWLGLSRERVIQRRRAATWGYTEPLSTKTGEEIGLDMIAILGGSFTMGEPKSEPGSGDSERPQHEVTLQPFYLGRYPVTQAQWRVVAGYDRIVQDLDPDPSNFKGDNRPVENVNWDDAQEFCQRLSAKTGKDYRLPSEAQWEYACRSGTTTPFHFGETIAPNLANYRATETYNDSPKGEYRQTTTHVGSFPANEWGLHDLHGNVWEWCEDDWHGSYEGAPDDGSAWVEIDRKKAERLLRGGSWFFIPGNCRSACRFNITRAYCDDGFGFRVCCVTPFAERLP
ncbi:MAG TPA: formylglycine-generating enzyme family protein [Coleofasciculaceae cyanobacterium]